mgnify:CR=1 FL=1
MKKTILAVVTATAVLGATPALANCDAGETVIKFSHVTNTDKHPKGIAATLLAERVNKEMNGTACMEVFPNSSLYDDNKVLEAMACGRPIVCSPAPLTGLNVESGLQLMEADSIDEWVNCIASVFEDKYRAEEFGMAANAWVHLNHRWVSCLEPLRELTEADCSEPERGIEVES